MRIKAVQIRQRPLVAAEHQRRERSGQLSCDLIKVGNQPHPVHEGSAAHQMPLAGLPRDCDAGVTEEGDGLAAGDSVA